jgi:DNA adenine methylase
MTLGTSTSGDRRRPTKAAGRKREHDARTWLRQNGHEKIAARIDQLERKWRAEGKKTRRNWWAVLAGKKNGRPCTVDGTPFPVLKVAQSRRGRKVTQVSPAVRGARPTPKAPARRAPKKQFAEDGAPKAALPAPRARPFVKWAGGKRQLLQEILSRLPADYGTFHEPFVGGGAVFFAVQPARAVLSDMNERLIRTYRGIKHAVGDVIALLQTYRNNKAFFLQMRDKAIDAGSDAEVAAWFIFLNKTGFNGLYRVNSKNKFNVPFGDNERAQICDEENLRACAAALAHTELNHEDFSSVLARAQPRDIVYFDPPYVPLSLTSYFTSYTATGFNMKDQLRLRDVALKLRERGVFVLISNSSDQRVLDLYKDFDCDPVSAIRQVNSNVKGRGSVTELLIT